MNRATKKVVSGVEKLSMSILKNYTENIIVPEMTQATIDAYDDALLDVVTDRNSKSNPNLYREDFINRLENFEFIKDVEEDKFTLCIPNSENFDFSGRLRVIERIMRGTAGVYVEMNENDYVKVFNKKPVNEEPFDEYVAPAERIYLIKYTGVVSKAEKEQKKKFVQFPFSNTPPIDFFSDVDIYVKSSHPRWVKEIKETILKHTKRNYQGARI